MDSSGQRLPDGLNPVTSNPRLDNRVRRFQYGLGSTSRGDSDRGPVVKDRVLESYQPSRAPSSFLGIPMFHEGEVQPYHSAEVGQHNGSILHKQDGWDTFPTSLQSVNCHMGPESAARHIPNCGTSAREAECSSRRGVQNSERQVRLDVEPQHLQQNSVPDGTLQNRLVCISPDTAVTEVLQLETRSRGRGDRYLQPGLVDKQGICQPTMVSDTQMSVSNEMTTGQTDRDNYTLEDSTMVSNHSGSAGGLSSPINFSGGPDTAPNRSGVHHESGSSRTSCKAHLRESFKSRGISSQASDLLLSSWRTKTQSNYNSLFAKWADWCQQRDRNPTTGPIEDVVNFLANLYKEGYKYRSLNAYRSAISSVHTKVDGQPVGQHPLISRVLKGAFNERPPLPRFSTFWDVGVVLRYLKDQSANKELSFRSLTLKAAMLLALTRPSRSVDLSKQDISSQTFTAEGLLFKPQHLS